MEGFSRRQHSCLVKTLAHWFVIRCMLYLSLMEAQNPARGAWNVVGKKFFEAMSLHRWIVVNFCSSRFGQEVTRLVQSLAGCCQELGESSD